PPALGLGHVDLELEVETPQGERAVAIADQIVKWRQQRRPRLEPAGFELFQQVEVLGMDVPIAFESEVYRNDDPVGFEHLPPSRRVRRSPRHVPCRWRRAV